MAVSPSPRLRAYAALPIAWAIVILVLTLTPAADMPVTPEWELLAFDTAAHAGVFGLLALLSWFSIRRQTRWPALARHPALIVLIGCFLFGGLIEVLQSSMHMGRQGDVKDLIGDTIGAALALGLVWPLRNRMPAAVPRLAGISLLVLAAANSQAQDIARARHTIETLASEKMHGRGYVRGGEHQAAAYLRGSFRQLGLQPLAPDYTQPFTLNINTFPGKLSAELHSAISSPLLKAGFKESLKVGTDFILAPNSAGLVQSKSFTCVRYDSVLLAQAAKQLPVEKEGKNGHNCLLLTQKQANELAKTEAGQQWLSTFGAIATIVPKLTASLADNQAQQPRIELLPNAALPAVAESVANMHPVVLGPQLKLQIDAKLERNYQTQNLAAVIRGSTQPDSFLVVSAHYDHLGMMGRDTYFPGANDNASGVALLLELAAHYAQPQHRPAYSVAFLLFGAEEAGLIGSSYFVAHPLIPLKSIRFLVNLDLLGTGEQGATVVNGKVFEPAYRQLLALNEMHHYVPQLGARGRAANSDHFPFSEAGVPAFFIYTRGGSMAYHDVNDQPAALSLAGFAGAFGLVRDFLDEQGAHH